MSFCKRLLIAGPLIFLLSGCNFLQNSSRYNETTRNFLDALLLEDYDKAISYFAQGHELAPNLERDSIIPDLATFRQHILSNWGKDLEYTLIKTQKQFSTIKEKSLPPNTTRLEMEFSNGKELGIAEALFDDRSQKLLGVHTLDLKYPVPNMAIFWLFGLLAIAVPLFNIYVIGQIRRSNLSRKWPKYLAVILLNVPSITYAAVPGLSLQLLKFQLIMGLSFSYSGYLNSYWTVGIPLGGLYWFWKLRREAAALSDDELVADTF